MMSATNSSNSGGFSIGLSTARFLDASLLDDGNAASQASSPLPVSIPAATPTVAPVVAQENDSSVTDYMSRLMQRVNGGSTQTSTKSQNKPVAETEASRPEPEKLLSSEEYVPKKQAPERRTDMSSLRKLANDSTRVAITSFANRQHQNQIKLNLGVSIAAALAAIPLFLLSGRFGSEMIFGGVFALAMSAFFGFRLYKLKNKKPQPTEQ